MGEEYPVVQRVFADTPAYDAGIAAGDIILSVDGKDLRILDLDGVLGRIRGVEGTKAKLVVQSGAESREVELARKVSDLQMVMTDMVNAKVGYINIVEFSGDSVNDFKKQSKTWIVRGAGGCHRSSGKSGWKYQSGHGNCGFAAGRRESCLCDGQGERE